MAPDSPRFSAQGPCTRCHAIHTLGEGDARAHARELMTQLERHQRMDFETVPTTADPRLHGSRVWATGRMFGVLECTDATGHTVILRAFSSLGTGVRWVDGWVPPILGRAAQAAQVRWPELRIKRLTRRLEDHAPDSLEYAEVAESRREASRKLMGEMHDLYTLTNFRGEERSIRDAFNSDQGIPGGVGDCCAPKLLTHAARSGLTPRGLVEFFWGPANPSNDRQPGSFYPACAYRCEPIMGFQLCGLS